MPSKLYYQDSVTFSAKLHYQDSSTYSYTKSVSSMSYNIASVIILQYPTK